jgi:hypothetical protein
MQAYLSDLPGGRVLIILGGDYKFCVVLNDNKKRRYRDLNSAAHASMSGTGLPPKGCVEHSGTGRSYLQDKEAWLVSAFQHTDSKGNLTYLMNLEIQHKENSSLHASGWNPAQDAFALTRASEPVPDEGIRSCNYGRRPKHIAETGHCIIGCITNTR